MIAHKRQFAHIPGVTYPDPLQHKRARKQPEGPREHKATDLLTPEEISRIHALAGEGLSAFKIHCLTGHAFYTVKRHMPADPKQANPNLLPHA